MASVGPVDPGGPVVSPEPEGRSPQRVSKDDLIRMKLTAKDNPMLAGTGLISRVLKSAFGSMVAKEKYVSDIMAGLVRFFDMPESTAGAGRFCFFAKKFLGRRSIQELYLIEQKVNEIETKRSSITQFLDKMKYTTSMKNGFFEGLLRAALESRDVDLNTFKKLLTGLDCFITASKEANLHDQCAHVKDQLAVLPNIFTNTATGLGEPVFSGVLKSFFEAELSPIYKLLTAEDGLLECIRRSSWDFGLMVSKCERTVKEDSPGFFRTTYAINLENKVNPGVKKRLTIEGPLVGPVIIKGGKCFISIDGVEKGIEQKHLVTQIENVLDKYIKQFFVDETSVEFFAIREALTKDHETDVNFLLEITKLSVGQEVLKGEIAKILEETESAKFDLETCKQLLTCPPEAIRGLVIAKAGEEKAQDIVEKTNEIRAFLGYIEEAAVNEQELSMAMFYALYRDFENPFVGQKTKILVEMHDAGERAKEQLLEDMDSVSPLSR